MKTRKVSSVIDGAGSQIGWLRESDGWITGRQPVSQEYGAAVDELPDFGRFCLGNVRYVDEGIGAFWMGEVYDPHGQMTFREASDRLFGEGESTATICPSVVACALGDTGLDWSCPANAADPWQAAQIDASGERFELRAVVREQGVEMQCSVVRWEEDLSTASRRAIVRFLAIAHGQIRGARFRLRTGHVEAVSFASADRLSLELPGSITAVLDVTRCVRQELEALQVVVLAETYFEATAPAASR